jgi:hypothetical protein
MSALTYPRHERFAPALANGQSASEAYVGAGYRANRANAVLKPNQSILIQGIRSRVRGSVV